MQKLTKRIIEIMSLSVMLQLALGPLFSFLGFDELGAVVTVAYAAGTLLDLSDHIYQRNIWVPSKGSLIVTLGLQLESLDGQS